MNTIQYTLIKIPIQELIEQNFSISIDRETELAKEYLVTQGDSLLFDQIQRLRGRFSSHIHELILVVAKKNPRQEHALRALLNNGFFYNGTHYARFGKSASQGKEGITAFVCDEIFDALYQSTQMDISVKQCVISKYEAQRCLPFSTCTLIKNYMPNIVIIGEYEKTLKHQLIQSVREIEKTDTDKETGETKTYKTKEVCDGECDITISPFDGCGCHEREFMETVSKQLGLDYNAVGVQVRLPFIKGYSVYVPFRTILKEWGYEFITDIYGVRHPVDTIDCIWNTTMFKGHALFQKEYGNNAWSMYQKTVWKYQYKLGISKYSHHVKNINAYTRMNFQYLQSLDLWNPNYINAFQSNKLHAYDILDSANNGKIITLAKYTTDLFEKIIQGEKFYLYKFMGITDANDYEPQSRYLEAALINDAMLNDPALKQFVYRKLKKHIEEAKIGKIYCSGFYHTGVGDMIGYLQYALGIEPIGCLKEHELYSGNFSPKELLSFRSPLVDPSEVNKIMCVQNELTEQWLSHFKDQDIAMFNMYDLSAPQQGGADFDGDIFFLCDDPVLIDSKINKRIVIDVEDKDAAAPKPYTKENIIEYEILTRDNRIGEITNAATSIANRYTDNPAVQKRYDDDTSVLRVTQGHEIDFIKTGTRWQMSSRLKKYVKQLPYFLLFQYPQKMKTYHNLAEKNKQIEDPKDKLQLNAYHSPSPMNELCSYICTWERRNILWNNRPDKLPEIARLIVDEAWDLTDRKVIRTIRRYSNEYADEIRKHMELCRNSSDSGQQHFDAKAIADRFRYRLAAELTLNEEHLANYVIKVSYSSLSVSKAFAWAGYGDYIIKNLKQHSALCKPVSIREVPQKTENAYEYLGKYYEFTEERHDESLFI